MSSMTAEQVQSLFTLAGFQVESLEELPNGYWPRHPDYAELREENPWWLVFTSVGIIKFGHRKRVWHIQWDRTPLRQVLPCPDDEKWITSTETFCHAYTTPKALERLTELRNALESASILAAAKAATP